ncbi:DoxX family protein [Pelagibacterium limicola]|uniref:DoxX family protein n=1 Tax=Pelagibacterium limicola TaxID=2791022 RepID=UPI0018AFE729|nr:DoxX family protein [Pelagibacterium limicola]
MTAIGARARAACLRVDGWIGAVPLWLALVLLRVALAVPFWRSGLTKWDGFLVMRPSTLFLFGQEFRLHILGEQYAYPFPGLMAWAAAIGEIVLPVLLVLGLFTRYAALGLLVMTAIIQLTVPDGWANFHLAWAAMTIILMRMGGGTLSLDAGLGLWAGNETPRRGDAAGR